MINAGSWSSRTMWCELIEFYFKFSNKLNKRKLIDQQKWWNDFQNDTNAVLLDVRTDEEIEEGMIPNAVHLDFYQGQDFINALESLDKTKNIYVYCRSGNRSGQACLIMKQLGFENTFNLIGGMNEWQGPVM